MVLSVTYDLEMTKDLKEDELDSDRAYSRVYIFIIMCVHSIFCCFGNLMHCSVSNMNTGKMVRSLFSL